MIYQFVSKCTDIEWSTICNIRQQHFEVIYRQPQTKLMYLSKLINKWFHEQIICTRVLSQKNSSAYELNHECASTSDLITCTQTSKYILFYDKTRVHMFYFDSKMARTIVPHIHTTDSICFFIHSLLEASHSHNGLYLLLYSLAIGSLTFTQHILSASLFTSYCKPHIHTTDSICFFIH